MTIFLDTSSLFKLYHEEADTDVVDGIFINNYVSAVYLSEIAKIEFASTVWKKVRIKEITEVQANIILQVFEGDFAKYTFVPFDNLMGIEAKKLIIKHGKQGLRTLDSIQLAACLYLRNQCELFVTFDRLLQTFFKQESLPHFLGYNG